VGEGWGKLEPCCSASLRLSTRGSITQGSRQDCNPWQTLEEDICACQHSTVKMWKTEEKQKTGELGVCLIMLRWEWGFYKEFGRKIVRGKDMVTGFLDELKVC